MMGTSLHRRKWLSMAAAPVLLAGCQKTMVAQETDALSLGSQSLAERQQDERRFDTTNESLLLSASAAVLQDFGFTIEEATPSAGLLMASKDRDAAETKQVAGQLLLATIVAAAGGVPDPVWEKVQKIRVSIVTRRSEDKQAIVTRVLFQRVIWNTKGQISRVETIHDHLIYQGFFDKLSQATFLTAHGL
jgi:hypothetical protein